MKKKRGERRRSGLFLCIVLWIELIGLIQGLHPFEDWLGSPSTPAYPRYSSHVCKGSDPRRRMCRFENVCMTGDRKIHYFREPAKPFVGSVEAGLGWNGFPHEFLYPAKMSHSREFSPVMVDAPRPTDRDTVDDEPATVAVLFEMFYPQNIGHVIADDLVPMYRLLSFFGYAGAEVDVRIVALSTCESSGAGTQEWLKLCYGRYRSGAKLLSDRDVLYIHELSKMRCFDVLLVGLGGLSTTPWQEDIDMLPFDPPGFQNSDLHFLRANALRRLRLPDVPPAQERILLLQKNGRRRMLNVPPLASALRREFPQLAVDVVPVERLSGLGLLEELRLFANASVVLLSSGGSSMGALFAHPSSCVLLADGIDESTNGSAYMEPSYWEDAYSAQVYHIPLRRQDCVLSPDHAIGHPNRKWLDYADCSVHIPSVLSLIHHCRAQRARYLQVSAQRISFLSSVLENPP